MTDYDPMSMARRLARHDTQASSMLLCLSEYEQEFNDATGERGWDWPLELMMIYRSLPPAGLADQIAEALHGQAVLLGIKKIANLNDYQVNFDDGPMLHQFLFWLAENLRTDYQEGIEAIVADQADGAPEVFGWALHLEGYGMEEPEGRDATKEMPRGWIKQHGGYEIRVIMAVDRGGFRYQIQRRRDTGEVTAAVDSETLTEDGPHLSGRVIEALQAVMDATPNIGET